MRLELEVARCNQTPCPGEQYNGDMGCNPNCTFQSAGSFGYAPIVEGATIIDGMLTTTVGSGTITIKR